MREKVQSQISVTVRFNQLHTVAACTTISRGTSQLVTWSTRHTVKSCDELTVVSEGFVTS